MRKEIWIACVVLLWSQNAFAQRVPVHRDTVNVAHMQFDQTTFNFGEIVAGARLSHVYTFKNEGTVPLLIDNVLVTCGCTVPQWTKTPVLVGQRGSIRVFFNSAGKNGLQNKTITILANTKAGKETIAFTAHVLPTQQ